MKKILFVLMFAVMLAGIGLASAANTANTCNLVPSLLNQDPIHAIPGDYVKVVFQLEGVENPDCGSVIFRVIPEYPFSLDPGANASKVIPAGTYTESYSSYATIPFTLRIDKDALDKNYTLKVEYGSITSGSALIKKDYSILVEDIRTTFDIFVQDYDSLTNTLTFDIVNTGNNDVDALTAEIVPTEEQTIKGSLKSVVGSLDAGQDATFAFESAPIKSDFTLKIAYTDSDGTRRSEMQTVTFDPEYFTGRKADQKQTSVWTYIIWIVILAVVVFFVWRFFRRRRQQK